MKKRTKAQRVAFAFGILSYFCALLMLLAAVYKGSQIGTENPIFASFAASVVFFVGAGVVLHVIGSINMPDLRINREQE